MASQFNTNLLSAYSNEQSKELFTKMHLGFETLDSGFVRVIDTVKESIKLKMLAVTNTWQEGGCGFNPSAAVSLSDKTFTNQRLKVDTEYCEEDLNGFSFEEFKNPGSNNGMEMELVNAITNEFIAKNQADIDTKFWTGLVTGSTTFPGIVPQLLADTTFSGSSIVFDWTATGNTAAVIIAAVENIYNTMAPAAQKDAVLYCSYSIYNKIAQAYLKGNYNIGFDPANGLIPGTSMKLVKVGGLNGTNYTVATTKNNLVYICDTQNETKNSKVWYSADDLIMKSTFRWRSGAGYLQSDYIVYTKPA